MMNDVTFVSEEDADGHGFSTNNSDITNNETTSYLQANYDQEQHHTFDTNNDNDYYIMGPNDLSNLSSIQEIILCFLGIPTSILSILCSFFIMKMVCNSSTTGGGNNNSRSFGGSNNMTAGFSSPYNRILFMFSICDIIASINSIIGPFMLPNDTSFRVWAFGNQTTCDMSGALFMFGISSFYYYWILSVYFLLTVRFQITQKTFAKIL